MTTILSRRINFLPGWSADPLDRRIALARTSLGLERLLPRPVARDRFRRSLSCRRPVRPVPLYPLGNPVALLLAAAVTATALALYRGLSAFVWPGAFEGARRLGARQRPGPSPDLGAR